MRMLFLFLVLGLSTFFYMSCDCKKSNENLSAQNDTDSSLLLLEKYPDSVDLINQIAVSTLELGDTAKSIQLLSQSLGLKLDQPEVENQLGFLLAAIKSEQSLLIATRMTHSEKAADAARGHYIKGLYFANTGNDNEAINSFDSSIISNFTFTDAYIEKAISLYHTGEINKAIDALSKAMDLDSKNPDVYYWMGLCLEQKKETEKALAYYQETLRLAPDHEGATTSLNNLKK
jgi:tetratricopeptide (TPR) repeat protein